MSTLNVSNLAGPSSTGTAAILSSVNGGPISGARNRIINGDMRIDQRNGGAAAVALNNIGLFAVDRWACGAVGGVGTGTASAQRVIDAPAGFTTSLKYTTTNAKTPAASDNFYVYQPIEGHNIDDIAFGTASAKPLTLSFWVKSSLTGTFSGLCRQSTGAPPYTHRSYVFSYAISVANTWEFKTVSIAADTAAGFNVNTDANIGLSILFDMGSGSTYETTAGSWQAGNFYRTSGSVRVISTLSATWQVTGVQLEPGTVATPFERRSYGQELALCQRYYEKSYSDTTAPGTITSFGQVVHSTFGDGSGTHVADVPYRVPKRALATVTVYSPNAGTATSVYVYAGAYVGNAAATIANGSLHRFSVNSTAYSISAGSARVLHYVADSEL